MKMMDAVKSVFSQYATFSGRARRSEYWYFTLFNYIVSLVIGLVAKVVPLLSILSLVYGFAVLIPSLAVCWRRLHDIGKSGAMYLIGLIPLVGWVLLLIWFCKDSEPGSNQYGPNPKDNVVWEN